MQIPLNCAQTSSIETGACSASNNHLSQNKASNQTQSRAALLWQKQSTTEIVQQGVVLH